MKKLLMYGILAALIYVAIKEVPPLLEQVTERGVDLDRRSGSISINQCVPAAEKASEFFGKELRKYSEPPVDMNAWERSLENAREHIYDAETRCACGNNSCERATEALSELNVLITDFDNGLRGGAMPPNPARQQETIDRLLKRAREFDRQGE